MPNNSTLPFQGQKAKLPVGAHLQQNWECHRWLPDFGIEDVWRFPVVLQTQHSLAEFRQVFEQAMADLETQGAAGVLFRFRKFLGRVFGWDDAEAPVDTLPAGSLRARYARAKDLAAGSLPAMGPGPFYPVYALAEESFAEISNSTVHAGLHLGRVPLNDGSFTVQMTVFNKPRGWFGRAYMALITPFRLWVVYPALLRRIGKAWQAHVKAT